MAEYEHQFKVIDEAQKILVVREMMPKDIKREFLTGPRKFDEIMEKLEIIINEMMADEGPTPMDLGNVVAYDAKTTQSDSDTSNDMVILRRVCHRLERVQGGQRSRQKKDQTDREHGIVEKELMNGRVAREITEPR